MSHDTPSRLDAAAESDTGPRSDTALRPATGADAPALATIEAESFASSSPWSRSVLQRELGQGTGRAWMVSRQGRAVGYALFRAFPGDSRGPGEAELLRMAIVPGARRRGLARELLETAVSALETEGIERCFLEVHVENTPALALYRGLGFVDEGRRRSYYPDGGDALVLSRPASR